MKRGIIISAIFSILLAPSALATNVDMKLEISPQACTLDTLNTGTTQSVMLQPEACRSAHNAGAELPGIPSASELADTTIATPEADKPTPSSDTTPGDQQFFEETIFEELAAWLGVGNKNAPAVQPMVTSIGVVTMMGVLVDSMFFKLRFTKLVRRIIGKSASVTFGRLLRGAARILRMP